MGASLQSCITEYVWAALSKNWRTSEFSNLSGPKIDWQQGVWLRVGESTLELSVCSNIKSSIAHPVRTSAPGQHSSDSCILCSSGGDKGHSPTSLVIILPCYFSCQPPLFTQRLWVSHTRRKGGGKAMPLGSVPAVLPIPTCSWCCLWEEMGARAQEVGANPAWMTLHPWLEWGALATCCSHFGASLETKKFLI